MYQLEWIFLQTHGHQLLLPKHVIAWVDTSSNQNNRLTVYILMPPGHPKDHYTIEVQKGGNEVVIDYTWPEEMLDPDIFMKGQNQYTEGHNKIDAFNEHVKQLRGGKDDSKVKSECRLRLPFQVEEQLTPKVFPVRCM